MTSPMETTSVTGVCDDMCPLEERLAREKEKMLNVFEMSGCREDSNLIRTSKNLCVKEYVRSAAGSNKMDETLLRPAPVLHRTVKYLVENIFIDTNHGRSDLESYDFMSDRIRAVRQDMVVQGLSCDLCIDFLAVAVRYHLLMPVLLHEKPVEVFDTKLNDKLLRLYLSDVLVLLDKSVAVSGESGEIKTGGDGSTDLMNGVTSKAELWIEFQIYKILLDLELETAINHCIYLYYFETQYRERLKLVLEVCLLYAARRFTKVLQVCLRLTFLQRCCLFHLYDKIRFACLELLNVGYSQTQCKFPLTTLTSWLQMLSVEGCLEFCQAAGVEVLNSAVVFNKRKTLVAEGVKSFHRKQLYRGLVWFSSQRDFKELVYNP